jgi:hypothetical protein
MSRLVVGAHLLCFINGRLFGEVTAIQWDSATPNVSRVGIDSLTPFELSPVGAKMSGNVSLFRLHGTGGLEGRGIVAPFSHIAREKYFSILIVDRVTGKRLNQADYCKVNNQSWRMVARQRVEGSFSFEGIDWSNEAEY